MRRRDTHHRGFTGGCGQFSPSWQHRPTVKRVTVTPPDGNSAVSNCSNGNLPS